MTEAAVAELKHVLGPRGWLEGADAASYERDERGVYQGKSLLFVRPANTAEVAAVVKVCAKHGVCIVPQGGNTGLCGGSVPAGDKPSIILSLARMNRIRSIDRDRFSVTAEGGCILQTIHDAAEGLNLRFGMDWGARGSATVGGGVSTNAGGLNVLKFGTAREQVLGLEVVLADGRIWDGLRSLRKDSSGYDLKHLFIGAEGTLGIVTKVVLKLYPRPRQEISMFLTLTDIARLPEMYGLARDKLSDKLTAFELLPGRFVDLAVQRNSALRKPTAAGSDWYVLVRAAGEEGIGADLLAFFEAAVEQTLSEDGALASSEAQERNFWVIRDEVSPMKILGGQLWKWDAAVPIDRMAEFYFATHRTAAAIHPGLQVYMYGHVGDGNWHMSVGPGPDMAAAEFESFRVSTIGAIDKLIWEFGGTISAEHGVGVENMNRIVGQKPQVEREYMAAVRRLFDPKGLFNPGKVIDPDAALHAEQPN